MHLAHAIVQSSMEHQKTCLQVVPGFLWTLENAYEKRESGSHTELGLPEY
jgi:hypothetical protein